MHAQDRLNAATAATEAGDYAAALENLVWFHEHALTPSPESAGVRRSYALRAWIALAALYPPAQAALDATRARAAIALLGGAGNVHTFRDVAAIDRYLQQPGATYTLYVDLEEGNASLALACADAALDAIIGAGDFVRAARLAPAPEAAIRAASERLHDDLDRNKRRRFTGAPMRWIYITMYIDAVQQVLAIVRGGGQAARLPALGRMAADLVHNPSVRRAVTAGLVKRPAAPVPELKQVRLQVLRARRRQTATRRLMKSG